MTDLYFLAIREINRWIRERFLQTTWRHLETTWDHLAPLGNHLNHLAPLGNHLNHLAPLGNHLNHLSMHDPLTISWDLRPLASSAVLCTLIIVSTIYDAPRRNNRYHISIGRRQCLGSRFFARLHRPERRLLGVNILFYLLFLHQRYCAVRTGNKPFPMATNPLPWLHYDYRRRLGTLEQKERPYDVAYTVQKIYLIIRFRRTQQSTDN